MDAPKWRRYVFSSFPGKYRPDSRLQYILRKAFDCSPDGKVSIL